MDKSNEKHTFSNPLKKYIKKDDKFDAIAVSSIIIIAVAGVCVYLSLM